MDYDATLYKVGLGPGDIVLHGDPAPPPQKRGRSSPNFRPMYCGQTAGWIKMQLGTEVGLRPGHFSAHVYCGQTAA